MFRSVGREKGKRKKVLREDRAREKDETTATATATATTLNLRLSDFNYDNSRQQGTCAWNELTHSLSHSAQATAVATRPPIRCAALLRWSCVRGRLPGQNRILSRNITWSAALRCFQPSGWPGALVNWAGQRGLFCSLFPAS